MKKVRKLRGKKEGSYDEDRKKLRCRQEGSKEIGRKQGQKLRSKNVFLIY